MTAKAFLQAELRLLYSYGEHTTFQEDAQRILAGLNTFEHPVTLGDHLNQAGIEVTVVKMEHPECEHRMSDGAPCGYLLVAGGRVCENGHRQW